MQRVLVEFFRKVQPVARIDTVTVERIAWEHAELAAAIKDRDLERARAMIRVQIGRYLPSIRSE
jgi:DNA-binding GntR family transcriptional regulator